MGTPIRPARAFLRAALSSLLSVAFLLGAIAAAQAATVRILPQPVGGTVTSSVGGIACGTGGTTCLSSNIAPGTTVTLHATADTGYSFSRWSVAGLGESTANPLEFPMPATNVTGSATFLGTAPVITGPSGASFQVGTFAAITIFATGTPAPTFAITTGTLPAGLGFAADGVLSGTPAADTGGEYPLTITASNGVEPDATLAFALTVTQPPAITGVDNATVAQYASFSIQFTATGWPPPVFTMSSPAPGFTLATSGLLSGTATTGGLWPLYVKAANGVSPDAFRWFTLTVTEWCDPFGPYSHTFVVGAEGQSSFLVKGYPPCTCAIEDGALPPGISIEQPCMAFAGTPPPGSAGSYWVQLRATNTVASALSSKHTFTVEEPPAFTSAPSATFVAGVQNAFTVAASGVPAPAFTITSGALPSGVGFAAAGTLSGTPAPGTAGRYPFTITATNGRPPDATQAFTLRVAPAYSARGDVNADRRADLFWREPPPAAGLSWWTMNGSAATGANYHEVDPAWQVADVGDFDGDGRNDLVWRRASDGATYLWTLDGLGFKGFFDLGILDPAQWALAGAADLSGDGKADIVWRGADGTVYAWLMNGGAIASQGVIANPGPQWVIADLADMDGDGKADIVFRNAGDGGVFVFLMNGLSIASGGYLGAVDPAQWTLAGAADFDGDLRADLLWRHATGDTWVWLMDGVAFRSAAGIGNPGTSWQVRAIGDFDADGRADLLWRHTDGTTYLWKMNGAGVAAYLPVADPGGGWEVVAP
jgi:hypothetical protein